MRRVLATAGHVDHGKSTLVRALTGRDPDRLAEEKIRGLTIELGFAWTSLPSGADVAFVDVPGHQRFVGTTLAGLGPAPAVVFVVAADQGWQAQSSEHLAAVRALGITDGVLALTRCDLADPERRERAREEAERRLGAAGLAVPGVAVSARTGEGMDELRAALDALVARLPAPDPEAPVRLWCDRSFTVQGSGTVVTGTLGAGTLRTGDHLSLLSSSRPREVVVRGLHSADVPQDSVGPVSRVAVNLRRVEAEEVGRASVLMTPDAFALARVVDVALEAAVGEDGGPEARTGGRWAEPALDPGVQPGLGRTAAPPEQVVVHVGSADRRARSRPLGTSHARLSLDAPLPWRVGDRVVVRDPGTRRLWAARVVDVDPLPLRRRGAARVRAEALQRVGADGPADTRLRSRTAEHPTTLRRLGLPDPTAGRRVGPWWVDDEALQGWVGRIGERVRAHHAQHPLSAGMPVAELAHLLALPDHLRPSHAGGSLPADLPPLETALVRHVAAAAGLAVEDGRVRAPGDAGLGGAENAVAQLEVRLRSEPFAAPEREDLAGLGLGPVELAAAARLGRILRLADDIVLLPDGPARAMRTLASLEQPFTLSAARQALGTTRRVAVPLLEHLDSRGWTRRVDGQLRVVVR